VIRVLVCSIVCVILVGDSNLVLGSIDSGRTWLPQSCSGTEKGICCTEDEPNNIELEKVSVKWRNFRKNKID